MTPRRGGKAFFLAPRGPASDQDTPIWMTVYSDMVTNLMLFFLLMFALNLAGETHVRQAVQAIQETFTAAPVAAPKSSESAAQQPLDDMLRQLARARQGVQVVRQGEGVYLRLPEPVLFDRGSAELKPEAAPFLKEIAAGLQKLPNTVVVEGHTDNVPVVRGPYRSNWELSAARAESVVDHWIRREGLAPERLAVAGYGEHRPFVPNDSDLNRALNRRIEILVILDEPQT
jgi:chemotaxis protein MotB